MRVNAFSSIPPTEKEQKNVLLLSCEPIPVVRIGFIGLGVRGIKAFHRFKYISGAKTTALCDKNIHTLKSVKNEAENSGKITFTPHWKEVCESPEVDLIYISTDWLSHTEIAVYAMRCGKHAAVEVPAAFTVAECWQLVNTAESTCRHCIMLENCCYDEFELNTLNMIRQGIFGEIIHAEGAYIHDLRSLNFPPTNTGKRGMNRQNFAIKHTGNLYPTHGLGPICQALNIHRGDRMKYLVSMSSKQLGITRYAEKTYGASSPEAKKTYQLGDMNTTLIYTELGKTIMLQHDVSNPRPYSRIHSVTAADGFFQKYPQPKISVPHDTNRFLSQKATKELLKKYEHPFMKEYGRKAKRVSGDHFFDYIMDSRLIYCLINGLPLDMDVYDAAEWSCLTELSEFSVRNGSIPVEIPDFTRGKWKNKT